MLSREDVKNFDITQLKKVHFIGITSGFNSFCAEHLLRMGVEVTASELSQNPEHIQKWMDKGILYPVGRHDSSYITEDLDLVIHPNAPTPGNPECEMAEEMGITGMTIGQLTGLIGKRFKTIAVAGTHGKTTTVGFVIWMLKNALGELPNFIIGDTILEIDKSYNYNPESEYLVVESCEYKRQFLDRAPAPYISVVTNIELDHTDYYKDLEDYRSAFSEFLSNTQTAIVIDSRQINIEDVLKNVNSSAEIVDIKDIEKECSDVQSPMPGKHNRENLLRACGVARVLDLNVDILDFPGIASRFEYKGKTDNGMPVYLDYAHNPRKVKACLQGVREQFPDKKIVFVWQPHSYERTYSFKEDFAKNIENADIVLIPNIYVHVREKGKYEHLISEEAFVEFLKERNPNLEIRYTENFEKTKDILSQNIYNDDYVAVFASAGDLKNIFNILNLKK